MLTRTWLGLRMLSHHILDLTSAFLAKHPVWFCGQTTYCPGFALKEFADITDLKQIIGEPTYSVTADHLHVFISSSQTNSSQVCPPNTSSLGYCWPLPSCWKSCLSECSFTKAVQCWICSVPASWCWQPSSGVGRRYYVSLLRTNSCFTIKMFSWTSSVLAADSKNIPSRSVRVNLVPSNGINPIHNI